MLAHERQGRIGPSVSLNTLLSYLTRLVTSYSREHGFRVPESVVIDVREVYSITHDLYKDILIRRL